MNGSSNIVSLNSRNWRIQLELTQNYINSYHPDLDFNFQLFLFNITAYANAGVDIGGNIVRTVTDVNRDIIVSDLEEIVFGANVLLQSIDLNYDGRVPSFFENNDDNDNNNNDNNDNNNNDDNDSNDNNNTHWK